MKKALIGVVMLALAGFICGTASAITGVPHAPIAVVENPPGTFTPSCGVGDEFPPTTPYGAPVGYTGAKPTTAGSMPLFDLIVTPEAVPPTYDYPVKSWPADGAWDFCACFDTAACSLGALSSFSTDIATYAALFVCSTDINGTPLTASPYVQPNGIPDGEFELGLLAAVLNNQYALVPAATGGKTNADIINGFKGNFQFFKVFVTKALANVPLNDPPAPPSDLRSMVPGLIPWVPSALVSILTALATEGDPTTITAADALVAQLGAIGITPPEGGISGNTAGFGSILGPEGDADGDGFTNRQEYNYFKGHPDSGSTASATVIKAQLTANITPPPTIPKVTILGSAGTRQEGDTITLKALVENTTALTYAWTKVGSATVLGTAQQLVVSPATLADAGKYVVKITTASDGDVTSNPATVIVVPAGQLPIAGGLGLALLAGACALGGVGSIRRRK